MHGVSSRKDIEQRHARLLEASGYPGPIAAAMVSSDEKSRFVAEAAEQRRLLREAGLIPARVSIRDRLSLATQRIGALVAPRRPTGGSVISTPDHA
jgi:hypothetical protein